MNHRRDIRDKLITYRELSAAERRALHRQLEEDPEAAELLAEYRKMDRLLARMSDPEPDPSLAREFHEALAGEATRPETTGDWLGRAPAVAGQIAAVTLLLLLVLAAGYLFRDQLQNFAVAETPASAPAVQPSATVGPVVVPAGSPTPLGFPGPTPTPAVTVDPASPFVPFTAYYDRWPDEVGMAYGSLRAGMTAFLIEAGGIEALENPEVMANLENRLRPHVANWGDHSLQLVDVYPGGTPELVVAILPLVDVYAQDDDGVLHVRGAGSPRYWPEEASWPQAVQVVPVTLADTVGIVIVYAYGEQQQEASEILVSHFDAARAHWQAVWRTATTDLRALPAGPVPVELRMDTGLPLLLTTCPAVGAFDYLPSSDTARGRLPRQDTYVWNGSRFAQAISERPAAQTERQYANVAEAYLRQGDFANALTRYRVLAGGETGLSSAPSGPDWHVLGALRAGQLHALLGEVEAAREMLARARLSSTYLGRAAGSFAEVYEATGDVANAWSALLADGELLDALADLENGLAGGPGSPLSPIYPGMALAAAIQDLTPGDLAQTSPPDLLARWRSYGLAAESSWIEDMDGDGALEIVVAQVLPSMEEAGYAPVSLLDFGPQGWFALFLGQRSAAEGPLPDPEQAPAGNYQLIEVGGVFAGWDGRQLHHYQPSVPGYEVRLRSRRAEHLCPLLADRRVVLEGASLLAGSTATPAPPTLAAPGSMQPAGDTTPTPTPWDQEGMPTPPPTATGHPYPVTGTSPAPVPAATPGP